MNTIAVKSLRDKIVVTFDKTKTNMNILLKFLERLEVEQNAEKINYPAASSGVSKNLNSVIPHLMRNPETKVKRLSLFISP
jgi:hypothetical protein